MDVPDGSPQSLCVIRATDSYPKLSMEKEDAQLNKPYEEIAGESIVFVGRTDDGVLALSTFRIFARKDSTNMETSLPLGLIENAQIRDLFHLYIQCKDASTLKCSFRTSEQCSDWQRRIQLATGPPKKLDEIFAFSFTAHTKDINIDINSVDGSNSSNVGAPINDFGFGDERIEFQITPDLALDLSTVMLHFSMDTPKERLKSESKLRGDEDFKMEVERLGFNSSEHWRVSSINQDFKLCQSYPTKILVPASICDDTLKNIATFRGSGRLPVVVWRHWRSGAVLARCSQPEVGLWGWRNERDEQLLKAIADACGVDREEQKQRVMKQQQQQQQPLQQPPQQQMEPQLINGGDGKTSDCYASDSGNNSIDGTPEDVSMDEVRKILIVDARSYTSAVTNRARGGGCECIEYYPCAEIEFMNLGNIHVIRKSFQALRQLCASPSDVPNWFSLLEKTMWLQHLSGLLAASMTVCVAIEKKDRPVLVHCSDGWDRTPQIVATAQLCLDPYYRTVEGFRILVEREWLHYGHKFADRYGNGPGPDEPNERCPVFLQWLDLVHQIHKQFPCCFEFNMAFLIKLAQHSLSCLFGTFLCNTLKERLDMHIFDRTFSVWPFLAGSMYRNPLYVPNRHKVLWPAHNVRDLILWSEVYLGSLGNRNCVVDFNNSTSNNCNNNNNNIHSSNSNNLSNGTHNGNINNVNGINHGNGGASSGSTGNDGNNPLTKTVSLDDLISGGTNMNNGLSRRCSIPNLAVLEKKKSTTNSNSDNNSLLDTQSEREDSPDIGIIGPTSKGNHQLNGIFPSNTNNYNNTNTSDDDSFRGERSVKVITPLSISPVTPQLSTLTLALAATGSRNFRDRREEDEEEQDAAKNESRCEAMSKITNGRVSGSHPIIQCRPGDSLDDNDDADDEQTDGGDTIEIGGYSLPEVTSDILMMKDQHTGGIEIQPKKTVVESSNLMQSIDLNNDGFDSMLGSNGATICNGIYSNTNGCITKMNDEQNHSDAESWYGSMLTSTDTLVPVEIKDIVANHKLSISSMASEFLPQKIHDELGIRPSKPTIALFSTSLLQSEHQSEQKNPSPFDSVSATKNSINSILPRVHSNSSSHGCIQPLAVGSSSSSSAIAITNNNINSQQRVDYITESPLAFSNSSRDILPSLLSYPEKCDGVHLMNNTTTSSQCSSPIPLAMDESIMIRPEHKKLEISLSGKCDTIFQVMANSPPFTTIAPTSISTTTTSAVPAAFTYAQRRRRTSSSNSRKDGLYGKLLNGNYSGSSRHFSSGGVRSLPMTPPGGQPVDRHQIAISCPDGLAHALSEQNIRLHQLVQQHKMRENALHREIHAMRMTLLKKVCPTCNNGYGGNDDDAQSSFAMDNAENGSICSWEAVEDRSGPSSYATTSSSTQQHQFQQQQQQQHQQYPMTMSSMNGGIASSNYFYNNNSSSTSASVLWVPDHAVSRCTTCQTEFWLGRRKHHCRQCGRIFCADCSEYWAPLPEEKLLNPVRLCAHCYKNVLNQDDTVDGRGEMLFQLQQIHQQNQQQQKQQQQHSPSMVASTSSTAPATAHALPAAATSRA